MQDAAAAVNELLAYASEQAGSLPAAECEVLYGRAGLLHAVLFAARACTGMQVDCAQLVHRLVHDIVHEGLRCGKELAQSGAVVPEPGFMHQWHGEEYLGAAHGTTGILQVRRDFLVMHHVPEKTCRCKCRSPW